MKPYLITVGEPAGIGPDCIIRALSDTPSAFQDCIVVSPSCWLEERAKSINIKLSFKEFFSLSEAEKYETEQHQIRCWNPLASTPCGPVTAGAPSPSTALAVIQCIESATIACLNDRAAALVTGPIEKAILKAQGFQFPGHTEFLAHLSRPQELHETDPIDFVMMLASETLRVALLTTHMALSKVPGSLSIQATLDCLRIVHHDLKERFGITEPRIGLCGLNPHAGEQGHFGSEELEILGPAASIATSEGINVSGPFPADTLFSATNRKNFDAIVCCYHDQALIPIKALSFGDAVNITLGLPFVRTSVDHGTALDLVGKENVSSSSLLAAIAMAKRMTRHA
ncbi:4-hydroxythreonine-4-phosphate dehydrogenase [Mariprofundus aestuarium]|uniref:4-hydroxythreonine-4-phosphate dehydrogenase n=1 Tax=Mariprofundus aestuarium TaxID=1921086 RepID=A0A2K8L023_MARES|nr:4-hydroxythreonine-4-phosphate dehydrogenase PdxA [Mariprofundus aestuarium]ATX80553.1 4-hydroxythreonine-4-phosphate dehydrogenase [Mariprofundus aestuarium]